MDGGIKGLVVAVVVVVAVAVVAVVVLLLGFVFGTRLPSYSINNNNG